MNDLRKRLGIDDWLEIVKEDRVCNGAYISIAQYMYLLEKENKSLKEKVSYLRRSVERKEEQIADWQSDAIEAQSKIDKVADYINYYLLDNRKFEESQKQFKRILQILERDDQ